MTNDFRQLSALSRPNSAFFSEISPSSIGFLDNRQSTRTVEHFNKLFTEEHRRHLIEEDIVKARQRGLWICRFWQLILTLNIVVIVVTISLALLLLFSIGPLEPFQTFGQSCRSLSCNAAHGLVCGQNSICRCPASDSFWSWNNTGCRRCPTGWSMINEKCVFISTFDLSWNDALGFCRSAAARLFTFSSTKNFTDFDSIVLPQKTFFIGLAEQPIDSNQWKWVDGRSFDSNSMKFFCSNGTKNEFDPIFRIKLNCAVFHLDRCLARSSCQRADQHFICEKI